MTDRICSESKDYIVAYKPSGIPSVPLKAKAGGTFLDSIALLYPEVLSVHGKNYWEGSAIHRLDTPTRGLIIFARNQESYDWLTSEQRDNKIIKKYRAVFSSSRAIDDGFEPFPYGDIIRKGGIISSFFRSFGKGSKSVRPVLTNPRFQKGNIYSTELFPESNNSVICTLSMGFRHQIRAHLAWAGHPLIGDSLYGGDICNTFGLEAIEISFYSKDGKEIVVSALSCT